MKKKLFIVLLMAVMAFVMCACGSKDETPAQENETNDSAAETAEVSPDYAALAEYYVFELEGVEYSMPCHVSDFIDNGWYIDPADLDFELDTDYIEAVFVYTDSSKETLAFTLILSNTTSERKNAYDCYVSKIELEYGNSCTSLTLKKAGVTIDVSSIDAAMQSLEDLKAAYGTEDGVYYDYSDDYVYDIRWNLRYTMENSGVVALGKEETQFTVPKNEDYEDDNWRLHFSLELCGPDGE